MVEISVTATSSDPPNTKSEEEADFYPNTMRKTKPGLKRLFLTLTVFISYLIALPFLLKSIEIYRAPLPFDDIDLLSTEMEKNHLMFPCQFQAVFVNFDDDITAVNELALLINSHMQKLTSENTPPCGTCGNNFTVAVTIDSNSSCIHCESGNGNGNGNGKWQCGVLNGYDKMNDHDENFDDYLESVLDSKSKRVYTVVVVNTKQEDVRVVVGKYRHAWMVGIDSVEKAVEKMAEIFIKVFVNAGKEEGSIRGEFMPIGADGKVVLSFSLLNSDPHDWIYDWDFKELDEILLAPIVDALRPVADISVESQVLYHTPKSSYSYWDDTQGSYIFSTKDLPFFVNSNEWHVDASTAAGGRSKVLHFVLYVPSAKECPLKLQLPNGEISMTNGFISPMWGGIIVWNPPACVENFQVQRLSRQKISSEDLKMISEVFMGQLRQLFGLKSESLYVGGFATSVLLTSEKGFAEWELDVLSRHHTCFNLLQCGTTLGSLSRLVQSLPRMIIMDEIGKQVKYSLEAAKLSFGNVSLGYSDASAVSSRKARALAEDAFYHPSMMSVSYYSFEHCFAVYSPFFLPVSLHVLLAVIREWKRYKVENRKYLAWRVKLE
ncbi:GPI transamidase component PIG-S-like [Capsicum chacoense]